MASLPHASPARELAHDLANLFRELGIRHASGIPGREIIPFRAAIHACPEIAVYETQHETGAVLVGLGTWFASGAPAVIYVTSAPGISNALTGLCAARATGARFVLVSPYTPVSELGRDPIQKTGTLWSELYTQGELFDLVARVESADQLPALAAQLATGFAQPGGFAAHIAIPPTVQSAPSRGPLAVPTVERIERALDPEVTKRLVSRLARERFAVWVGFGARKYADAVRRFVSATGVPVMSSPRALGVADTLDQFIGVTGNGGHAAVFEELERYRPETVLVLGSGLGESTSAWDERLVPPRGFVHVDLDPRVFGRAFAAPTLGVVADIGEVLDSLLAQSGRVGHRGFARRRTPRSWVATAEAAEPGRIHPSSLLQVVQRVVLDATDIPVVTDPSSAMFNAAHHLTFRRADRYFSDHRFGAVGWSVPTVLGLAAARGERALALCGDHAMHCQEEIATAVRYALPAIWLVVNNGSMNIVSKGMERHGRDPVDLEFPETNFALIARAKGAEGRRVTSEAELEAALLEAVKGDPKPFLIDAVTQCTDVPLGSRGKR